MNKQTKLTPEIVLWCIDWINFCGYPTDASFVDKHFQKLYLKGIEFFVNWHTPRQIVGVDPRQIKIYHSRRSDEDIVNEVLILDKNGEPLYDNYVATNHRSLYNAARKRSSWGYYIELAGLDYAAICRHVNYKTRLRHLTKEKINRITKNFSTKEKKNAK